MSISKEEFNRLTFKNGDSVKVEGKVYLVAGVNFEDYHIGIRSDPDNKDIIYWILCEKIDAYLVKFD